MSGPSPVDPATRIGTATGPLRQTEIYLEGLVGKAPVVPLHPDRLESYARQVMTPEAFAYVSCGAGLGATVRNNRDAFGQWRIVPRMLRAVSTRDPGLQFLGLDLPAPLLLAPIGVQALAHQDADLATARAASSLGVPMIFSNQASVPMETCAEVMGDAPRLFQLYWSKNRDLVASLVRRAEACGCRAIVVTLDTTILGWRIEDLDIGYLPFLRGEGIAQYTSDPVFRSLLSAPPEEDMRPAIETFVSIYSNPALTWSDLAFLREHTSLPVFLKGILHPDDARRALDEGMDGIVVSNHGGRQVDGAIGALEALPGVAEAVAGRVPILFDSGVRGGADIFKTLALGASAVCLGRPYIYGLSIGGESGVRSVIENTMADFDLTLGLAGCRSVDEATMNCLVPAN